MPLSVTGLIVRCRQRLCVRNDCSLWYKVTYTNHYSSQTANFTCLKPCL